MALLLLGAIVTWASQPYVFLISTVGAETVGTRPTAPLISWMVKVTDVLALAGPPQNLGAEDVTVTSPCARAWPVGFIFKLLLLL